MFRQVIDLVPPLKKALKWLILSALLIEVVKLVPAVVFKELIDTLVSFTEGDLSYIAILVGVSFTASAIVAVASNYATQFGIRTIISSEISLLKSAQQKLMSLSLGYHETRNTSELVTRLTKGIHHMTVLMFHSIFDFMPVIFQILYSVIFIFFISWKVGLVFIVFIPIFLLYTHKIALRLQPLRKSYHKHFEDASGKLGEMVINVRTVKDFTQEKKERKQFEHALSEYQKNVNHRIHFEENHSMGRDIIMQIGRICTLAFSVYLVYTGEITAGSLVLIVTLNEKASSSITRIGKTYNYVGDSISGVRRILDLMDKEPEVAEKKHAKKCRLKGKIDFKDVDFSYVKGDKVLQDINISINPKETVAIVGRSGCGKSTLIKLLYRHFDVDSGQILLDGTDIRDCSFDSFRSQMAIVSQDVELFNATIYENITYGSNNPSRADVVKAAKLAYAHDFIEGFSNGYETIVGEKGVKLSGGQKQRIGIARALLRKPAILVFDEATSSLDTESEKTIQKAMKKLFNKQTMIVIAHRLSTIEHADKIIVLEDGKITEQGTHDQLMKQGGIFKRMRKLQAMGEIR